MKLALHRSITFWSGIFVMGFICWAWTASIQAPSAMSKGSIEIQNHDGCIYLGYWEGSLYLAGEPFSWQSLDVPDDPEWFSAPAIPDIPGIVDILIPHWLLLLAVAIPWSALLLWRARRRRPAYRRLKLAP